MARKPSRPRAVLSVSVPLDPDYVRANRAAGVKGETIADFVREAIRQRANRILGKPEAPTDTPADDLAA